MTQPLLKDLIDIPESVGDADFVVHASERADLTRYVVTDDLRQAFDAALTSVGHAITSGRSQATFVHGSFGSGKSHFMAVLREILAHDPDARAVRGLAGPVAKTDDWLPGKKIFTLACHMLDARSVEQAILSGYLAQVTARHPEAPAPAVHHSDALLADAANLRATMGDEKFFAALGGAGGTGGGLAMEMTRAGGWTAQRYDAAAAQSPGTTGRDDLVSALTSTFFSGAVRSGEFLDLDTGLAVITRHAKELGYDAMVLFLDELILWLSTKIADHTFVSSEGAKLNKLVESSDATRPLPIVSFVARQRNLEEFLGPQVGGTEREALATVMRSVQGRLGEIVLADTNLPEIVEKRLLKPKDDAAREVIDRAFAAVRGNREVWDTLLLGAQYGDAGIGSDAAAFRRLYPFSPALVATLVALSQALQRERTALRVLTELLVDRRDTLRVNDLIGVADLFDKLVLHGQLPDRLELRQRFQDARDTYTQKLRPLLLAASGLPAGPATTPGTGPAGTGEDAGPVGDAAGWEAFRLDDRIVKTLLLGAVVAEVPALHNLTAAKLHALNFGSIASPIPGYENQIVLDRLRRLATDAGSLTIGEGPDPVVSIKLSSVDYDKLLDLVPYNETATGVLQQLVRELVCRELGLGGVEGTFGELPYPREWRGRRHVVHVRFGNVRDRDTLPDSALLASGREWRLIIDYPFDPGHRRNEDFARIEQLPRGPRSVFWMPRFVTDEVMTRVAQLAKIDYLLGGGAGDRLEALAADWSVADRQQGKIYLQQRQQQLRASLAGVLRQAYGAAAAEPADVEEDSIGVLHSLADGLALGEPHGGTLKAAFDNLVGDLLSWAYPGRPALPDDERQITRGELTKVLDYARQAAADPTHGTVVATADRRAIARVCNPLKLGELAEHRYVLTASTCWWSGHLRQRAATRDYTDHFPVHVLRDLLDEPDARGFDRDLQNLIIAVFALEQQLAWYHHDGRVAVDSVRAVDDTYVLRRPPMPGQEVWSRALERVAGLFGRRFDDWRTPATVAEVATWVRGQAARYAADAAALAGKLTEHATLLGLDPADPAGRLATARRVAGLLARLRDERDDVVLFDLVAGADLGDIDDQVAATSFTQARAVLDRLDSAPPWLSGVALRVDTSQRARQIIDTVVRAARYDQHAKNLADVLREQEKAAMGLFSESAPSLVPPAGPGAGPGVGMPATGATHPPVGVTYPPGGTAYPSGGVATGVPGAVGSPPAQPGAVDPAPAQPGAGPGRAGDRARAHTEKVTTADDVARVAAALRAALDDGLQVTVTWEAVQ